MTSYLARSKDWRHLFLRLAPATLLMEDDEGSTPLDLLARAPLFEVATSDRTGPTLAGLG